MATLKIHSDIVDEEEKIFLQEWGLNGISFQSVDEFIGSIPEDDKTIDIRLHCRGGDVVEGWAIYDALRQSGKEITTTIEGECSSMATIILLAAPKERRKAYKNAHFSIHNPEACDYALNYGQRLTAENLDKAANAITQQAEQLRSEQERILSLYVERTGADREALQSLMNEDVMLGMDKALELGFISEILPPITAKNRNLNTNKKMKEEKVTINAGIFSRLLAKAGLKKLSDMKIIDIVVTAADGTELTIERESGEPQVGDAASPDGTFVIEDGTTIVVADGVITEIIPVQAAAGDDVEQLKAENAELKEQVAKLEADKAELEAEKAELETEIEKLKSDNADAEAKAKTEEETEILDKVAKSGGNSWLDKVIAMKSTFNAHNTRTQVRDNQQGEESPVRRALEEMENKINAKK